VISKDQWDKAEAVNLVNIMMRGGVEVTEATSKFKVGDIEYDAGTYILYGAQPFRPYLSDLMEKQNYPDLYLYPGGPPVAPYDLTGWTLPMSMGVKVDRVTTSFTAKTKKVESAIKMSAGNVAGGAGFGYSLDPKENLSALAINRLLKAGEKVSIAQANFADGKSNFTSGTFVIEKGGQTQSRINDLSKELGISFSGIAAKPSIATKPMKKIKVGLYKSWDANIDEGWTRWVLEQFEFDIDTLHNSNIIGKDLSAYTAIIFPSQSPEDILQGHRAGTMPEPYVGGIGLEGTLTLNDYVKKGGVLLMFDQACDLAIDEFGLPVRNVVRGMSSNQFFIPGSIIRMKVNTTEPLAFGMKDDAAASFSRSRAFESIIPSRKAEGGNEIMKPAPRPNVTAVATYSSTDILMSGWALGQDKIKNKGAMMNVAHGNGNVILFGFRPQFRGQSRNTYKLIFNSIYLGATR
jgi:hypothetical protein